MFSLRINLYLGTVVKQGDLLLKITFKNMESSQLARDFVEERFNPILENNKITLLFEIEKHLKETSPDLFTVSLTLNGQKYKDRKIKRSSYNFFYAITELADGLNELLRKDIHYLVKINSK